ncbi:MAG: hypothetical protein DGJ47_001142, partial [Rickettsiaceae bacterium]
ANKLDFDYKKLTSNGLKKVITFLKEHPQIIDLSLCDTNLQTEAIKTLSIFLKNSNIETLKIGRVNMDLDLLETLMSSLSKETSSVTSLALIADNCGDELISTIMEYLPKTRIESLNLSGNELTNKGVRNLTQSVKKLTFLELSCNEIDDEGAEILRELLEGSNIECLDLEYNDITKKGSELFADVSYQTNFDDNL